MNTPTRIGRCPRCGKSVPLTPENPWRPFCSERCKAVDFGDWLDERHRIMGDTVEPPEESRPEQTRHKETRED